MDTATEERLREAHGRIARLEARVQEGTADTRSRMQGHIDALRRDEQVVRASVRMEADAAGVRLEQLDNSIELAEHRIEAELAPTEDQFTDELEAELDGWDAHLERMQTWAASKTGDARESAEATIAELRQRRLSIGARVGVVGAAAGDGWRDAKSRALAELDELKTKADTAWRS